MKYSDAVDLASEFAEYLRDCCLRIEPVGSVKRGDKEEVHDIELLLIADPTPPPVKIFQTVVFKNKLEERLAQLLKEGVLREARKKANGEKQKRFAIADASTDEDDFCLELFIVRPETWGIQNVIRTGPGGQGEFSQRFVTNKAHGGLLPDHLQYIKGETKIIKRATGEVLSLPEEADAIAILGLGWIEPCDRRKYG